MKNISIIVAIALLMTSCNFEKPTEFSGEVLKTELTDLNETSITLEEILNKHKGKKIIIDVWASWCRDCIEGLPAVKDLQSKHKNVSFVFLSLDRSLSGWKNGIKRYNVEGDHYYLNNGWDGPLDDFLNLNWIPRYLVVDEKGKIMLFKATRATDSDIKQALEN